MHPDSYNLMATLIERNGIKALMESGNPYNVLDVGSYDVNGSYKALFHNIGRTRYIGADIAAGRNVDLVLDDPYVIPLQDKSVDLLISGQTFEHCEYFWVLFKELVRVTRDDGHIIIIAPAGGGIHRYPVDVYRFHPDAYQTMAKIGETNLVDIEMLNTGNWNDVGAVFKKNAEDKHEELLHNLYMKLRRGGMYLEGHGL